MSWIKTDVEIEEGQDSEKIKNTALGKQANILKVHTLLPDTKQKHEDFYRSIMFGKSALSRIQREMIAVVVSRANMCGY
jgi:alkylhydroperoxidase family enzyme